MNPMQAAIPIMLFMLFMIIVAAVVVILAIRFSTPPCLTTKRFYLDPSMSLSERRKVLSDAKKAGENHRFYNYYVVLPTDEVPIFDPNQKDLLEAEFLIVEYLESETAKTEAA